VTTTLQQLADLVRGEVVGDPNTVIVSAKPLQEAGEGDITFAENDKSLGKLRESKAAAVVVGSSPIEIGKPLLRTKDPLAAFVEVFKLLRGIRDDPPGGIDPRAVVDSTARIGRDTAVMAFAVVGANSVIGERCRIHPGVVIGHNCRIGDDVTVHANAVLYDRTEIQDRSTIHANSVIGADGFGYRMQSGRHVKVPQLGSVVIGPDVEIGAATTIDRGTFGPTRIGEGTKIDNLVMIGHNCQIGKHNILVSQVGIAGSCVTGDYVVLAGQVGIADHVTIGTGAQVGAKSGIHTDIPAGERWLGCPAMPDAEIKRIWIVMDRLPEMRKDLKILKSKLGIVDKAA
jgi:UDP-3-O-[3-hydroxymyristoyl] glucosamine N-acyltransferase